MVIKVDQNIIYSKIRKFDDSQITLIDLKKMHMMEN